MQCTDSTQLHGDIEDHRRRQDQPYVDLRKQGHQSSGLMDVFASIALATQSTGPFSSSSMGKRPLNRPQEPERAPKRARSEKLPSPDWLRKEAIADTRPATSYESVESRMLEAQLLLNFSQAARLTFSSPASQQEYTQSLGTSTKDLTEPLRCGTGFDTIIHRVEEEEEAVEQDTLNAREPLSQITTQLHSNLDGRPPESERESGATATLPSGPSSAVAELPGTQGLHALHTTKSTPPVNLQGGGAPQGAALEVTVNKVESFEGHQTWQLANSMGFKSQTGALPNGCERSKEPIQSTSTKKTPQWDSDHIHNESAELQEIPLKDMTSNEPRSIHATSENDANAREGFSTTDSAGVPPSKVADAVDETQTRIFKISSEYSSTDVADSIPEDLSNTTDVTPRPAIAAAVCAACKFARNSLSVENDNNSTSWISCDGCKSWFHFACAGFKSEREVRSVDKFRCKKCKPIHGSTTYVRKSSRAHSAIDYAGLHQGVIKTSDERPEHHYIQPIKDGAITFLPENFARMRPELVTAEYFEKGSGMKEPIVIPASLNPRPTKVPSNLDTNTPATQVFSPEPLDDAAGSDDWSARDPEYATIPDEGQDALDMVIPQGLTVRQVAELYGPEEKVEVIDVKSQNGENKKWNMRRWADYYENHNNKVVRNVISLEVSRSRLGRLIRRPKIVRDLDLQDSVWPEDLLAKGEYPRVQFYCLMSVADCFTDFHIDFGGSSVFYHILKGKKTFLFIPPKEKHLKKYEEWCMSPAQNWTFLADQTKECYRVDLAEGDTMLIPAGWIHAVWTPEDSLVIGGNFLTRSNFGMQLRVAQVEKATGVARKFRYPHFQKLHWFTALRYLEDDPLPENVKNVLHSGENFQREQPTYHEFDAWGENSQSGTENYHARYYSQSELDGLPDLTRYLLRTALIDLGSITEGITAETRNSVKKSIPRGHGEPLDVVKSFAAWCAWKRGNEPIPHWAYPDAVPDCVAFEKLSAAAIKKLDREAALQAPRRQSARMQSQQRISDEASTLPEALAISPSLSEPSAPASAKRLSDSTTPGQADAAFSVDPKRRKTVSGAGTGSHRKTACESCRKRRRACKHKDQVEAALFGTQTTALINGLVATGLPQNDTPSALPNTFSGLFDSSLGNGNSEIPFTDGSNKAVAPQLFSSRSNPIDPYSDTLPSVLKMEKQASAASHSLENRTHADSTKGLGFGPGNSMQARPRTKACDECRKSKARLNPRPDYVNRCLPSLQRRCIHDEFGNEDPIKVAETAIPRPHARKLNIDGKVDQSLKKSPEVTKASLFTSPNFLGQEWSAVLPQEPARRMAPVANMIAIPPSPPAPLPGVPNSLTGIPSAKSSYVGLQLNEAADTMLAESSSTDPLVTEKTVTQPEKRPQGLVSNAEDHLQPHENSPTNVLALRDNPKMALLETSENFERPDAAAASSLVSPPASSHDDIGNSPVNLNNNGRVTPSPSSSRHSSHQPQQVQRSTPESGPMRRASGSPYEQQTTTLSKAADPASAHKQGRRTSEQAADEDSLRLIKELQAQEYGLRRRGRA